MKYKSEVYRGVVILFDKYDNGVVATIVYPDNFAAEDIPRKNKVESLKAAKKFINKYPNGG